MQPQYGRGSVGGEPWVCKHTRMHPRVERDREGERKRERDEETHTHTHKNTKRETERERERERVRAVARQPCPSRLLSNVSRGSLRSGTAAGSVAGWEVYLANSGATVSIWVSGGSTSGA